MAEVKIFILPEELDKWMEAVDVKVDNDTVLLPDLPASYKFEPAIYFTRQVAGEEDPDKLVGKVKPVTKLEKEGLEYFQNSVIAGDNAYEALEGFIISYRKEAASTAAQQNEEITQRDEESTEVECKMDPPSEPPPGPPQKERPAAEEKEAKKTAAEEESPEDMLARLILEKIK